MGVEIANLNKISLVFVVKLPGVLTVGEAKSHPLLRQNQMQGPPKTEFIPRAA